MRVAGIVVTYNRKELLLENIEALLKQTRADCLTIIVIDNNSTDGTRASLEKYVESKRIIYVNTGKILAVLAVFIMEFVMLQNMILIIYGLWMMIAFQQKQHWSLSSMHRKS